MVVRMVRAMRGRVRMMVGGRLHGIRGQIERVQFWICVPGFEN